MTAVGAIKCLSLLYLRCGLWQEGGSSVFSVQAVLATTTTKPSLGTQGRVARAARARFKCAWHDRLKAAGADSPQRDRIRVT